MDIQRSFTHSCVRMESKLHRVPTNHCPNHSMPLALKTVRIGVQLPPDERENQPEPVNSGADDALIRPVIRGPDGQPIAAPPPTATAAAPRRLTAQIVQATLEERSMVATRNGDTMAVATSSTAEGNSTFAVAEMPVMCETCVEHICTHIKDLCKRALHKTTFVVFKPEQN